MKKFLLKDRDSVCALLAYLVTKDFICDVENNQLEVTIKNLVVNKQEKTRSAQKRLRWLWTTDIAKNMSLSKDECNEYLKKRFLLPIYIRDNDDWAETYHSIRDCHVQGLKTQADNMYRFITAPERLVLRIATVSQAAEYLREVELFAHDQGWTLRTDNDYYQDAMR